MFQSRISLCVANATELNSRKKLSAINFLFHLASMTEKGGSTPVLKINDRKGGFPIKFHVLGWRHMNYF